MVDTLTHHEIAVRLLKAVYARGLNTVGPILCIPHKAKTKTHFGVIMQWGTPMQSVARQVHSFRMGSTFLRWQ